MFNWFNLSSSNLGLILCIIEMLRRIIWNLFRVEKEHIANCGLLNAVPKVNYKKVI